MTTEKKKTILLTEDDAALADTIATFLQKKGMNVVHARTHSELISKLKNQTFDLILLDMKLGEWATKDVIVDKTEGKKSLNVDTPIIVISGHLDKRLVSDIRGKIACALVKPFPPQVLMEKINTILGISS